MKRHSEKEQLAHQNDRQYSIELTKQQRRSAANIDTIPEWQLLQTVRELWKRDVSQ
jgi:hypothetical protein